MEAAQDIFETFLETEVTDQNPCKFTADDGGMLRRLSKKTKKTFEKMKTLKFPRLSIHMDQGKANIDIVDQNSANHNEPKPWIYGRFRIKALLRDHLEKRLKFEVQKFTLQDFKTMPSN